jgi:Zn-dependent protease with chaperone function
MNQDELRFVTGHEMGRYVLRHAAQRIAFKSILILVSFYVAYLPAGPVIGRFNNTWEFAAPSHFARMPLGVLAMCLLLLVGSQRRALRDQP